MLIFVAYWAGLFYKEHIFNLPLCCLFAGINFIKNLNYCWFLVCSNRCEWWLNCLFLELNHVWECPLKSDTWPIELGMIQQLHIQRELTWRGWHWKGEILAIGINIVKIIIMMILIHLSKLLLELCFHNMLIL